jgi:hypothetical protein
MIFGGIPEWPAKPFFIDMGGFGVGISFFLSLLNPYLCLFWLPPGFLTRKADVLTQFFRIHFMAECSSPTPFHIQRSLSSIDPG